MDIMCCSRGYGAHAEKLSFKPIIFTPFASVVVYLVIVLRVIEVYLIWVDTNNGAYQ